MNKYISCGNMCVKFILDNLNIKDYEFNKNMYWCSELAIFMKNILQNHIAVYYYSSKLIEDYKIYKDYTRIEAFDYIDLLYKYNVPLINKTLTSKNLIEEIKENKYLILCVESSKFNGDKTMTGGHFIVASGIEKNLIFIVNPLKNNYEYIKLKSDFLIYCMKDFGCWRIHVRGDL